MIVAALLGLSALGLAGCRGPANGVQTTGREATTAMTTATITIATTSLPTPTPTPPLQMPVFDRTTYPKVDGSTATIPLSESLAAALLDLTTEEASTFIHHNTTHHAYVNLIEGLADIIFVTEPSSDELELAAANGIELEVVPVVKEAFVFLVNAKNPVTTLSQAQIRAIYTGDITNWQEVGGPDRSILAYQRPENSGSQTIMENQVMAGLEMAAAPTELKPADMSGLIEVIASYDNSDQAIGYSVYYYASSMYSKETVRFVAVDGVAPDPATISSDTYPFTSAYYAVMRNDEPADSAARQLLAWLLSDSGQQLAQDSGYVPLRLVGP